MHRDQPERSTTLYKPKTILGFSQVGQPPSIVGERSTPAEEPPFLLVIMVLISQSVHKISNMELISLFVNSEKSFPDLISSSSCISEILYFSSGGTDS